MIFSTWSDYRLSRLMLGTVQFGLPYGVANRTGQPEYRDVLAIVAAAIEAGVNCFDTAANYGTSEAVLGRALLELGVTDQVLVVTKVRPVNRDEMADPVLTARAIEQSITDSRQHLRIDCLPLVLFHTEADAVHLNVLEKLQARGWLRQIGVSCENRPGSAAQFAANDKLTALQIPGSVVDQRHQRSGVFHEAAERGVAVFIRSVYLQGLLVMPEDEVPAALGEIIPVRRTLTALADQAGMTLSELALRYMLSQPGVTCVLTGVETIAQVRDNIVLFDRGPLAVDLLSAIEAAVPDMPEMLITPAMWPVPSLFKPPVQRT